MGKECWPFLLQNPINLSGVYQQGQYDKTVILYQFVRNSDRLSNMMISTQLMYWCTQRNAASFVHTHTPRDWRIVNDVRSPTPQLAHTSQPGGHVVRVRIDCWPSTQRNMSNGRIIGVVVLLRLYIYIDALCNAHATTPSCVDQNNNSSSAIIFIVARLSQNTLLSSHLPHDNPKRNIFCNNRLIVIVATCVVLDIITEPKKE